MNKRPESAARKLSKEEETRINSLYFKAFGPEGMFVEILKDLEAHFETRTLVGKSQVTDMVDPNQTLVNCGAYEHLSYMRQRIKLGEQNK